MISEKDRITWEGAECQPVAQGSCPGRLRCGRASERSLGRTILWGRGKRRGPSVRSCVSTLRRSESRAPRQSSELSCPSSGYVPRHRCAGRHPDARASARHSRRTDRNRTTVRRRARQDPVASSDPIPGHVGLVPSRTDPGTEAVELPERGSHREAKPATVCCAADRGRLHTSGIGIDRQQSRCPGCETARNRIVACARQWIAPRAQMTQERGESSRDSCRQRARWWVVAQPVRHVQRQIEDAAERGPRLAHCEKQEEQATDNQDGKRVVRTPSRRELASRPQQGRQREGPT